MISHRSFVILLLSTATLCWISPAMSLSPPGEECSEQTLIFIRHAEKSAEGFGQINCQGLNRSLALPSVIKEKFGKPDVIFAPNPTRKKADLGNYYYYLRPLATIEPTAIHFNMPINTRFGQSETEWFIHRLSSEKYANPKILISWAHREIINIARTLMTTFNGDLSQIPHWENDDFDSIYILKITRGDGAPKITFTHDHQGLNELSTSCPEPASHPTSELLPEQNLR
ncbi:hypothetical protein ABF220_000603 [Yersinia ruckeri]